MNAVVDIGNTLVKFGLFEEERLLVKQTFTVDELNVFEAFVEAHQYVDKTIVCSVVKDSPALDVVKKYLNNILILGKDTPVPIKNLYFTPETLGYDRLAAAAGAYYLAQSKAALVVNAGTTITYEYVSDQAEYKGGAISPGLQMRFKALESFTSRLPLVSASDIDYIVGKDTDSCIKSGVINGLCMEIDGMIQAYANSFNISCIYLSGGDAKFLENRLKNSIFVEPNIILFGLNTILNYNVVS